MPTGKARVGKPHPRWKIQERRLAAAHQAKRPPQSGAGVVKGDVLGAMYSVSCKTTTKSQFTLTIRDLRKMVEDAHREERLPVMQVEYNNAGERFAILRWQDFEAMLTELGVAL